MFKSIFKNFKRKRDQKRLKNKEFDFLFDEAIEGEYVSLDCETTGLNPKKNINPESIKIHHLRQTDLQNAQEPEDAIFELLNFIGSRPIIGYYIEFDMAMISKYTKNIIGIKLPNESIEVSGMYYDLRKSNDAIMTAMMFIKLKELLKNKW